MTDALKQARDALDDGALMEAAWARHKYRQNTGACIAFKHGAEWATERVAIAAADAAPVAQQFGIIDPDYARIFTQARIVAWQYGWACLAHGSFTRDLDLLLVPWTDAAQADDVDYFAPRIADAAGLTVSPHAPSVRPHGRKTWTLLLPGFAEPRWVDLSVMTPAAPPAPAAQPLTECNDNDSPWLVCKPCAAAGKCARAAVTEAMVTAYLMANDAYWKRVDAEPTKLGKWRNGTPSEATRVSLAAALQAAQQEPAQALTLPAWLTTKHLASVGDVVATLECAKTGRDQSPTLVAACWIAAHWLTAMRQEPAQADARDAARGAA